jgi:uncharacterized protein YecE (DUF72 family)
MIDSRIHIGTSGWNYNDWIGKFYPSDISRSSLLDYYAHHFNSVEINNSFYQLPAKATMQQWHDMVGESFLFAVKASRYITHTKKLREPEKTLDKFLDTIAVLETKLGPVLFQLPPRWSVNIERLEAFLQALPEFITPVFEFRNHSWLTPEVSFLCSRYEVAFCIYEIDGFISPKEITSSTVYIRLHGPGAAYKGKYDTRTLAGWAGAISTWYKQKKSVFCFFDNDEKGYAAENAVKLQRMLTG